MVEQPGQERDLSEEPGQGPPYNPVYLATRQPGRSVSRSSRAVAWLMDEIVSIPGTRIKFGLDSILGIFSAVGIPVGDMVANMVSSVSLVEAIRRGLPFRSTLRILGNILLNAGAGSIPVAGDFFSLLFRSNSRNRDVIEGYLAQAEMEGKRPSWWRVIGSLAAMVLALVLAVLICLLMYGYVASRLWQLLGTKVPTIFQ